MQFNLSVYVSTASFIIIHSEDRFRNAKWTEGPSSYKGGRYYNDSDTVMLVLQLYLFIICSPDAKVTNLAKAVCFVSAVLYTSDRMMPQQTLMFTSTDA